MKRLVRYDVEKIDEIRKHILNSDMANKHWCDIILKDATKEIIHYENSIYYLRQKLEFRTLVMWLLSILIVVITIIAYLGIEYFFNHCY